MRDQGAGIGGSGDDFPEGRPPPTDPDFYLQWGKENAKDALKNATAALVQLLNLSTALLGGAVAVWKDMPISDPWKLVIVAGLLATLLICLFSAMPSDDKMLLNSPGDIRDHMDHALKVKKRRLLIAKWSLAGALILLFSGLVAATIAHRL